MSKMSHQHELPPQVALGAGEWFVIHTLAHNADTEEKKKNFVYVMEVLRDNMVCDKCKAHTTEFMKKNPFQPYWNINNKQGKHIGLFTWTWNFHNTVNERLGKPIIDWVTAYNMYSNLNENKTSVEGICRKKCPNNENVIRQSLVNSSIKPSLSPYQITYSK